MRSVLIGLGALYGLLFVLPRWGWEAGAVALISAVVLDRVLKAVGDTEEKKARKESDNRRAASEKAECEAFRRTGCRFLGTGKAISVFEDLYDAARFKPTELGNCYSEEARQIVRFKGGFVVAANPEGWWPSHYDEARLLRLLTILSRPADELSGHEFKHISPSSAALAHNRIQQHALLEQIEAKVTARASSIMARQPSDLGSDATAVYVITTAGRNACKVGISNDPERRRAGLQTGNAQRLKVHRAFWLWSRSDAKNLENESHRMLRAKGFCRIGEWFTAEPEIVCRSICEAFSHLIDSRIIVEDRSAIPDVATDEEILAAVAEATRWRFSNRGNLVGRPFDRSVTIYKRRGEWRFVVDGEFSSDGYASPDRAQLECLRTLLIPRERALAFLAGARQG